MSFRTNKDTGNVFPTDKKPSGSHHGSVRPQTGIKSGKKHCFECGAGSHDTSEHEEYAKRFDEKYFTGKRDLNRTWVEFYGTDEDRKEFEKQQKEIAQLHEKWGKTFGYRPNKFSELSTLEIESDINYYQRQIQTFSNQRYDEKRQKTDIAEAAAKIKELEEEWKIRKAENESLKEKIEKLDNLSGKELLYIRRNTRDQIAYDAVVWVLRKRGLWKGSTEKTEEYLKNS